ncbi:MAG: type I glutamate--ammonia ligase [Lachnospiraceae bacterium]|nr:type I glutamate--ammonia ligase [Lachnospiraceae bacterium]
MAKYTKEEILALAEEENVEFIRLQFTDVFGNLKNKAITAVQLERALNNELMFDGSAIDGFARGTEADMYLYPDPDSWVILPWRPQHGKVARMLCDVYTADRKPFAGDPRRVLKLAIEKAAEMGYTFHVGPECEFFLFRIDEDGQPTTQTEEMERAGYFDIGPIDSGENARRDMVLTLEEMGFTIESSHHEQAPAQHEIDFSHDEAMQTADNVVTFKMAVKTIARRHGQHATFMPKPKYGNCGSGMHLNMSLHRNGENIFRNDADPEGISQEARWFIGGIMTHIKGMTAILNPLVNSYKRLVPGYDAPVWISWSGKGRGPLLGVPADKGPRARVELRSPDSAANPYLALAVVLRAGLEGIEKHIEPPAPVEGNLFTMPAEELKAMGVESLPTTLMEAVHSLEGDSLVQDALGPHIAPLYIEGKKKEFLEYSAQVSQWEVDRYLYKY